MHCRILLYLNKYRKINSKIIFETVKKCLQITYAIGYGTQAHKSSNAIREVRFSMLEMSHMYENVAINTLTSAIAPKIELACETFSNDNVSESLNYL